MTELKALGKKPPKITIIFPEVGLTKFELCKLGVEQGLKQTDHYRQALLEAADEIEKRDRRFYTFPWIEGLVKRLRISAGVEEK